MKKNVLRFLTTLMLAVIMIIENFALLGQGIAIAINEGLEMQANTTNVGNIEFDAYFLSEGNKIHYKESTFAEENILVFDVNVKKEGILTEAKIKIENANFKIKQEEIKNNYIKNININENTVELNQIIYENNVKIEIPIIFEKLEKFDSNYFEKENTITLTGTYEDANQKQKEVTGEIKTQLVWKQETDVSFESEIEKYINLGENGILLQQKILTKVEENRLPRENEKLNIIVPKLDNNLPEKIKVLANGMELGEEKISYNQEEEKLQITNSTNEIWGEANNKYQIIYYYAKGIEFNTKTINSNIEMITKLYNQNNITKKENKDIEIVPKGNIVSITKETTDKLYKGYLYAKTNETLYKENNTISISDTSIDNIEISKGQENFLDENEKAYDITSKIIYKSTIISKEEFEKILGEEGYIKICDSENNVLNTINNQTEVNEEGNIVIEYQEKLNEIKFITSKPIEVGEINIQNIKAITEDVEYTKEQIKTFSKLKTETKISVNTKEINAESTIILSDTKTEAKIEIDKSNLSTLQTNQNVQFLITLLSNSAQYDLYKNPKIEIVLPKEINIDVKNISQLNKQDELQIINPKLYTNNSNQQIISLELQGEQKTFVNDVTKGIQVAITADISIENTLPSKETNIVMNYTNENKKEETFSNSVPIKLNSKYGALIVNKITGYNEKGDITESIDDKIKEVKIDTKSEKRIVTQEVYFMNNYETEMTDTSIIGKIPGIEEGKTNFELTLLEGLSVSAENVNIYYSEDVNATKENDTWKTEIQDITKVRAFKIELQDGKIAPQSVLKVEYKLVIPERLTNDSKNYSEIALNYNYNGNSASATSAFELTTENVEEKEEVVVESTIEETEQIKVEIVARSGGKELAEGDNVYEGQGIKYILKITNKTDKTINNVKLEAINTNAIYYNYITYEAIVNGETMTKAKIAEDETLKSKTFEIEQIEAGETKEVNYQISVKEVTDENQTVTGTLKVNSDEIEEKTINMIENKIVNGKLKLSLEFGFSEDVYTGTGHGFPIDMKIKNTTDEKLTDIIVELPVSEQLIFSTEYISFGEYEFIEYVDNVAKFKIAELEAGAEKNIGVQLIVDSIPVTEKQIQVIQYFKTSYGEEKYVSNEIERTVYQTETNLIAKLTTNIENGKVKDGDNVKYYIYVENNGAIEYSAVIEDILPEGLDINSVKMTSEEKEEDLNVTSRSLRKGVTIRPYGNIKIEIDTTVNVETLLGSEISNYVEILGTQNIKTDTITILVEGLEETENPDESGEEEPEEPDEDEPENPDNIVEPYTISGTTWIDSNENGMREVTENKMSDIEVILLDEQTGIIAKDINGNELQQKIAKDGTYKFTEVKQGKYIVIFKYDVNKYTVTEYQKQGISETMNSDVIYQEINLDEETIKVATTKTIEIKEDDVENIDAGFVENKIFDLSLNKYINKIIVQNNNGTAVYSYNKETLTKIEIDSKMISNTNVIIEYNIEITNEGEIAGYANEIIDYMPADLTFSSEMNKDWYTNTDGNLCTKTLSNTIINPGEKKSINLTLIKKMTQNNTGTTINIAEINKDSNDYMIIDIDSTAGNKKENEDDISKVETIISIKTGNVIIYVSLVLVVLSITIVGIYLIKKKVLV